MTPEQTHGSNCRPMSDDSVWVYDVLKKHIGQKSGSSVKTCLKFCFNIFFGIFFLQVLFLCSPLTAFSAQGCGKDIHSRNDAIQFFQKGILYLNASGSRLENRKKAYVCFRKSALQGYSWGEVWLGVLYYNGWGVGINHEKARKWWKKAAEKGNPWAQDRFNSEY
jgi:hypothetical protein